MAPTSRDLRDRVTFQRRASTPTAAGGVSDTWNTLIDSRFVKLTPINIGRRDAEPVLAARAQGKALFDLWVRWDSQTSQVGAGDRVVDLNDATRVFNIHFNQDMDGRRQWLLMQLEIGVASG